MAESDPSEKTQIMVAINNIGNKVDHATTKIDLMHSKLFGNGTPGVLMTVDRHDRWIKVRAKFEWILIIATVGVVIPAIIGGVVWLIRNNEL